MTGRAIGLSRRRVMRRHAVPNALLPVVTLIALNIGFVLSRRLRDRVDLLVARHRRPHHQRDRRQGLPGAAGRVPPARPRAVIIANFVAGHRLRLPRPAREGRPDGAPTCAAVRQHGAGERAWHGAPRTSGPQDVGVEVPAAPALGILIFFTVMALTAPWLAPEDPTRDFHPRDPGPAAAPSTGWAPTATAPTCCRGFLLGSRISIAVGFAPRSSPASSAPSSASRPGYYGGWVDKVLTAIDDWFLVIPFLPFAIVVRDRARPASPTAGRAAA